MTGPNEGFSFGSSGAPGPDGDRDDEVDAVEVSGEPISRKEARNMGIVSMDPMRETSHSAKLPPRDDLPSDISPQQAEKLTAAREHLKNNETEKALTLAQELVFEYPSLVAAKLIIARCFINRKEFEKGLAILQAIPEDEKNPDTYYYIGRCQSRLGKIKEAIDALKTCRSLATDNATRKRANDLLLQLQGEQAVCPICGKKTLYDSMVEIDNQLVCANCAKTMGDEEGDEDEDEEGDEENGGKRRRRLRPPLTKYELLMRLLFFLLLLGLLALGVVLLYLLAPTYYTQFRSVFPENWSWLPAATHADGGAMAPPHGEEPIKVIPTMVIDSAPLEYAIAGVEVRRHLSIEGLQPRKGEYRMDVFPSPAGPCTLNAETGEFLWKPAAADAGKSFEISFRGIFGTIRSRDQVNTVTVSPGPAFRRIWSIPDFTPDKMVRLRGADVGNGVGKGLLVAVGEYWRGRVVILKRAGEEFEHYAEIAIPGRPVDVGMIPAGDEKWLAVADYWNSRIRYYALRDGSPSELSIAIDLPGRPVLVDFNSDDALIAALCRTSEGMKAVLFRQESQQDVKKIGDWTLPDEPVWRKLLVLGGGNAGAPARVLAMGADFAGATCLLVEGQDAPRFEKNLPPGVLLDAAFGPNGRRVHALVEEGDAFRLFSLAPGRDRETAPPSVDAGGKPALGGIAAACLLGRNSVDLALIAGETLGISLGDRKGGLTPTAFWPLEEASLLFGGVTVIGGPTDGTDELVYTSANGDLWAVGVPKK